MTKFFLSIKQSIKDLAVSTFTVANNYEGKSRVFAWKKKKSHTKKAAASRDSLQAELASLQCIINKKEVEVLNLKLERDVLTEKIKMNDTMALFEKDKLKETHERELVRVKNDTATKIEKQWRYRYDCEKMQIDLKLAFFLNDTQTTKKRNEFLEREVEVLLNINQKLEESLRKKMFGEEDGNVNIREVWCSDTVSENPSADKQRQPQQFETAVCVSP